MFAPAPRRISLSVIAFALTLCGCAADGTRIPTAVDAPLLATGRVQTPRPPAFDLNVELRGTGDDAEGQIKFRQPNDGVMTIFLDTRVEGLLPDHDYLLQRAAVPLGGGCVDGGWLTLGLGTVVTPIHTDREGEGGAQLFRSLPASFAGTSFDIHFRIVDAVSTAVVLTSACLKYTANPN